MSPTPPLELEAALAAVDVAEAGDTAAHAEEREAPRRLPRRASSPIPTMCLKPAWRTASLTWASSAKSASPLTTIQYEPLPARQLELGVRVQLAPTRPCHARCKTTACRIGTCKGEGAHARLLGVGLVDGGQIPCGDSVSRIRSRPWSAPLATARPVSIIVVANPRCGSSTLKKHQRGIVGAVRSARPGPRDASSPPRAARGLRGRPARRGRAR